MVLLRQVFLGVCVRARKPLVLWSELALVELVLLQVSCRSPACLMLMHLCQLTHPRQENSIQSPLPWTTRKGQLSHLAGPAREGSTKFSTLSCRQLQLRPPRATSHGQLTQSFRSTSDQSSHGT